MKAKIYLDFNSTHPPYVIALDAARDFYLEHFANSSGLSLESQIVNKRIEESREEIAALFGIEPEQIVFTSCATESNNLIIHEFHRRANRPFRVLSSPFEHPSVAECLKGLTDTEITYLPANLEFPAGEFDLIAMMAVQNETGSLLPVDKLPAGPVPLLVDFSQALPKLARDAAPELRPDIVRELTQRGAWLTATGHKVGAGFGAGLIILPQKSKKTILLAGGNQEMGYRAGSHNTAAIIALATALTAKLAENNHAIWYEKTRQFENLLREKLSPVHETQIIGENAARAPGTTLLMLKGIAIDFLVMALDKEGITVSTGTSCKSRSRSPSAALIAMGYNEAEALSVVRLSYDQKLTAPEMERVAEVMAQAVAKLTPAPNPAPSPKTGGRER